MLLRNFCWLGILLSAVKPCIAEPQPFPPTKFEAAFPLNGRVVKVVITSKKFDRKKHKMVVDRSGDSLAKGHPKIDGRIPFGADGYAIPHVQIDRFEVTFDGKRVIVPRALYSDCYSPVLCLPSPKEPEGIGNNQNSEKIGNIRVVPNESANSFHIIMKSYRWVSDCYEVLWLFRPGGTHYREVHDFGP